MSGPFYVDPSVSPDVHEKQKVEQYLLAVEDWNNCDNSKRFRIPLRRVPVGGTTDKEGGTTDKEEGTTD